MTIRRTVITDARPAPTPARRPSPSPPPYEAGTPIPMCCHRPCSRFVTRSSNRNGNAGRPYFACTHCKKFLSFDDERGIDPRNPLCRCRAPSRRQLTGQKGSRPRTFHYVCSTGDCGYFSWCEDGADEVVTVDDSLVDALARLGII
ncbi:hypothetical protein HD806DRAFT_480513 [Xylariaceae sp. AK1471]|nr:hypothetical protein HD806DRAFT_480513 [Xylariaceae sp. AK1471]